MAEAKKLPSGKWRALVYAGKDENGKRKYESFTADTRTGANKLASEYADSRNRMRSKTPFSEALENYINSKSNILSPSTVRCYRTTQRNCYGMIKDMPLDRLTDEIIQKQINANAATYSAKSIKNQYGLITAVLKANGITPGKVSLKPKEKTFYNVPTGEQIIEIIKMVEGSKIEFQILFALMLGLRQSEIAALKWENLNGDIITIKGAVVPDEHNKLVEKRQNKTYDSTRQLKVPSYLLNKLNAAKQDSGKMFSTTPITVARMFRRRTKSHGLPPFRVHDLRHANASIMLKLGVPDKYAMERGGWSDTRVMKNVYQHTFTDRQEEVNSIMDAYFNSIMQHEMQHEK